MQHILYRQKEQFSDGVGYSWIDGLKANAENHVGLTHHSPPSNVHVCVCVCARVFVYLPPATYGDVVYYDLCTI